MNPDSSSSFKQRLIWSIVVIVIILGIAAAIFLVIRHKENALPANYTSNRANFTTSIQDASNSINALNKNDNTSLANSLILQSVAASKHVSNAFLTYLSPQLENEYRNNLIQGELDYYNGVKQAQHQSSEQNPGTALQEQSIKLEQDWINWWKTNYVPLYNKAYARSQ